jgi:hypothetical protein
LGGGVLAVAGRSAEGETEAVADGKGNAPVTAVSTELVATSPLADSAQPLRQTSADAPAAAINLRAPVTTVPSNGPLSPLATRA